MSLIKSISGFRGTMGGFPGDNLTPLDVVKFTAAYACFLQEAYPEPNDWKVVVGRDGRVSGDMVNKLVCATLMGMGMQVYDIGLSTTPTVEMEVIHSDAIGGVILTASHNPFNWNALKLLNSEGEFLNASEGRRVLDLADASAFQFVTTDKLGKYNSVEGAIRRHIDAILALDLVDAEAIRKAGFKVAFDAVNSTGGIALPMLLEALGVRQVIGINAEPTGVFAHNPEPLPEHLTELCETVRREKADVGFVVDPDVDRLALIQENGEPFVEEYTLVSVADYVLQHTPGNTVSNLSSTRALQEVTEKHGGSYSASAVGEVNVVAKMKETGAVIGGEGNGGVIYPALHYGRDALVGIALFLTQLAHSGKKCSELRKSYPEFVISKNRMDLVPGTDVDALLQHVKAKYADRPIIDVDGVRINFDRQWVHLRKSNTEPIIRIYAESGNAADADALANKIIGDIKSYLSK